MPSVMSKALKESGISPKQFLDEYCNHQTNPVSAREVRTARRSNSNVSQSQFSPDKLALLEIYEKWSAQTHAAIEPDQQEDLFHSLFDMDFDLFNQKIENLKQDKNFKAAIACLDTLRQQKWEEMAYD